MQRIIMANSSLMVLCVTVNDRLMLLIWRAVTFILTFYTLLSGTRDPPCRPTPARVTTVRRGKTLSHFISHSVVFAYWNDIGEDVGFNPNRLIVISIVYVRSIILTTVIKSLNQIIILLILVVFFVHIFYLVFFFNYFVFDSCIYIRFCFLACTDKTCISYWVNCCCLFLNNWLLMHFFLVHVALPPTLQRHVLHPSADRNFWPSLYTLPLYLQARVYIA